MEQLQSKGNVEGCCNRCKSGQGTKIIRPHTSNERRPSAVRGMVLIVRSTGTGGVCALRGGGRGGSSHLKFTRDRGKI